MSTRLPSRSGPIFAMAVALAACGGGDPAGGDAETDADADTDADGDVDADADADADAETDGEAQEDADAGPDADADDPPEDECFGEPVAGERQVPCEGLRFYLSVPEACLSPGCGLIVDVHGLSMTGQMEDNNTDLRDLGRRHGYVVVQPTARGTPPTTSWSVADDAVVFEVMMRVAALHRVDEGRIHFTGFSQGGFMTWRFVCDHADVLASAAPAAAGLRCGLGGSPSCAFDGTGAPSREIPILFLFGRRDTNYVEPECTERQRDAMVAAWGLSLDAVVEEDADHRWTRYVNARGTVVETLEHDYISTAESPLPLVPQLLGHCYPGSDDPGGEPGQLFPFGCDPPNAFHWGEAAMAFFVAHPRSD